MQQRVVIVGAGMSGLACAVHLSESGVTPLVFESSDDVGGRVRTDIVDGFRLDRGFQVLLTAYPEARRVFDYDTLRLARFEPGALVYFDGRYHRVSDPWRRPQHALATLASPVGSLADKLRIAATRRRAGRGSLHELFLREQQTTAAYLRERGFSERMVTRFLQPFLRGIFLEPALETSSRMFEFVLRMFARGDAALPAGGMSALPQQLAARLPGGTIRLATRVAAIEADGVTLEGGERVHADVVVAATDAESCARLYNDSHPPGGGAVTCLYYAADSAPVPEAILVLNGTQDGPVNNLCVPSQVTASYAPPGQELISVSVIGEPAESDAQLDEAVRTQLRGWFDDSVQQWRLLRIYRIAQALPAQTPWAFSRRPVQPRRSPGRYVCGDHCLMGSLQGALQSGRAAAEAVLEDIAVS